MVNTRIKVKRDVLIGRLRDEVARRLTEHKKALMRYDSEQAAFALRLEEEVTSYKILLADDYEKAFARVGSGFGGEKVAVGFPRLRLPIEPKLDVKRLDKMISILDAAMDETISIAADDDYARYL